MWECGHVQRGGAACRVYRQLHRRFYFPSATPQLRVSQPQNVSSPSLYSPVKLDFIGLLSILRSPRKYFRSKQSQRTTPPRAAPPRVASHRSKIRLRSDRPGAVCTEKQSRPADSFRLTLFSVYIYIYVYYTAVLTFLSTHYLR